MELFGRSLASDVVFIAELGVNHEGDVETASRLLKLAADAGADAVKLQSYTPSRYVSASDPERLARVGRFALDEAAHRRLAREAEELGVPLFSTPVSEDVVPLLDELFPAIKIASGDISFEPVIRAAARTGKPVILSTGAAELVEVDQAVAWVEEEVGRDRLAGRLVLMQCTSAYPTPIEEACVGVVPLLAARYGVPVGYSNHVIGPEACLAAIALGASVIEVHVTDNRIGRSFRDHELSFLPGELRLLVEQGRRVRTAIGGAKVSVEGVVKTIQPSESANIPAIRKGVIVVRDLVEGSTLTRDDLGFARPGNGFLAAAAGELIGRRLAVPLSAGQSLQQGHLALER